MIEKRRRRLWRRGARIRVRNRFNRSWSSGFEVERQEESGDDGHVTYKIRRLSDGSTLPTAFEEEEIGPDD